MVKGQKVKIIFPTDELTQNNIRYDEIKSVNLHFVYLKAYQRLKIRKKTLRNENTQEYSGKIRIEVM